MMDLALKTQIERRRKRGEEDIAKITNKGSHPVYSVFETKSYSDRIYTVRIRSLTERLNSCTCADYHAGGVGTCKHIEGVLAGLKKKYTRKWNSFISQAPPVTQVYIRHAEETTIRVTLPLPKAAVLNKLISRYFDPEGILQGKITQSLPALLSELDDLKANYRDQVHVEPAVMGYLKNQQDIERIERQKVWFLDQVKSGRQSLNLLSTPLYGFQEEGVSHLAFGRRAMLADDMGLGKTVQAIAAAVLLKQLRDIKRVLIVTPASLKHQWAREIRRFTSLSVQALEGNQLMRRALYRRSKFFNVVNYELIRRDLEEIKKQEIDLVILDEAQRIKNWRTKTADCVKRLESPYAFVLTGTPLENRLDELYSIFQFIDPTILGPLWQFNRNFFDVERRESGTFKVKGYKNLDQLRRRISPYVLRRLRDEVRLDLPDRIDSNFFVEMTKPQMNAYSEFQTTVAQLMSKAQRRPLTPQEHNVLLGCLIKMRLICNALALHDNEVKPQDIEKTAPKIKELKEILDEEVACNGHKTIIFSQWSRMLELIIPVLDKLKIGWVKLTGSVPTKKRGALINRFFESPQCKVFLSTDAGGVGLNLQAASMVINVDLPWNPAVLDQRIARAHRHGQRNPVNVVNLIAKGTIEEKLLDTLAAKRAIFDAAFQTESDVIDLSFENAGQSVLQRLEVILGDKMKGAAELELAPSEKEEKPEKARKTAPTLDEFSDLLVGRYPGRIMLIRKAPQLPGAPDGHNVLVVVDKDPAQMRPEVEKLLNQHYQNGNVPGLLLMEQEGYRALSAMTGGLLEKIEPQEAGYQAPAIPQSAEDKERKAREKRLKKAGQGFDAAEKKLKLAGVLMSGGFPEETMNPLRQALGWSVTSMIAVHEDAETKDKVPSARIIESKLTAKNIIDRETAAEIERIRNLTAPPDQDEDPEEAPAPSRTTIEQIIRTVEKLIDSGRETIAKESI